MINTSTVACTPLFTVPLYTYRPDDSVALADDLRRVILDRRAVDPGVKVTNVGGWHSKLDLQEWADPAVERLVAHIFELVGEVTRQTVTAVDDRHLRGWRLESWANVNEHGHLNLPHVHTRNGNQWSGVFYVDEGDSGGDAPTGRTFFQDRSQVPIEIATEGDPFRRERAIEPEKGVMVLFPGTAWHYVERYEGHRPRITIAFNLANPAFTIPSYEPTTFWWINFRGVMRCFQMARAALRRPGNGQASSPSSARPIRIHGRKPL